MTIVCTRHSYKEEHSRDIRVEMGGRLAVTRKNTEGNKHEEYQWHVMDIISSRLIKNYEPILPSMSRLFENLFNILQNK